MRYYCKANIYHDNGDYRGFYFCLAANNINDALAFADHFKDGLLMIPTVTKVTLSYVGEYTLSNDDIASYLDLNAEPINLSHPMIAPLRRYVANALSNLEKRA